MLNKSQIIREEIFNRIDENDGNYNAFCTIADHLHERESFFMENTFSKLVSSEEEAILLYVNAGIVVECYEAIKLFFESKHAFTSTNYNFHEFLKFSEKDENDLHFIKNIRKIIIHPRVFSIGKGRSWITNEVQSNFGYFYDGTSQYVLNETLPTCENIVMIIDNIYDNIIKMLSNI